MRLHLPAAMRVAADLIGALLQVVRIGSPRSKPLEPGSRELTVHKAERLRSQPAESHRYETLREVRPLRVTASDGSDWIVRIARIRLPRWRTQDAFFDESVGEELDILSIAFAVVLFPFTHLLVPCALYIVELPIALGRAVVTRDRWVEAASHYPTEQWALWRTPREDAPTVAAMVAAQLAAGEPVRPARAEFIERVP